MMVMVLAEWDDGTSLHVGDFDCEPGVLATFDVPQHPTADIAPPPSRFTLSFER